MFVDLVHVSEYLLDAAWCFFDEGDRAAGEWVIGKMRALFEGKVSRVAAAIRGVATRRGVEGDKRKRADRAANYLIKNADQMRYDRALAGGLPVTTSPVDGACRSFVSDRFEPAGARWSLDGAEALLRSRGVYRSADWDEFWRFHVEREQARLRSERPA